MLNTAKSSVGAGSLQLTASSNQYVSLSSLSSIGTNGISFSVWFSSNGTGNNGRIFGFSNGVNSDNIEMYISNNNLALQVKKSGSTYGSTNVYSNVNSNTWTHVAWTMDISGVWKCYVNGTLSYTNTLVYPDSSVVRTKNYIGKSVNTSDPYFNGNVDEFKVYFKTLSQTEVTSLYMNNVLVLSSGMLLSYHCDVQDVTSSGNAMYNYVTSAYNTLVGSPSLSSTHMVGDRSLALSYSSGGSPQYIVPSAVNFGSTSGFTMCMWVKNNYSTTAKSTLFNFTPGSGASNATQFSLTNASVVETTNGTTTTTTIPELNGDWHHITVVFGNTTTRKVYIDGVLQASYTGTPYTSNANGSGNAIGYGWIEGSMFDGLIDDVRLYSSILDDNSILTVFSNNVYPYTVTQLRVYGYTALELRNATYSDYDIIAGGYSVANLVPSGISSSQLKASGRYTDSDILAGGYDAANLRAAEYATAHLKGAGYTASQLRVGGYSIAQINDSEYLVSEMLAAGFSATELKSIGYTTSQLRGASYTAAQMYDAGYTASQMSSSGFSMSEIRLGGYSLSEFQDAGYSITDIMLAGFPSSVLKTAGYTAAQLFTGNYPVADLQSAGYTTGQIILAGYNSIALKQAGYQISDMKFWGLADSIVLGAGFTATELKTAGYNATQLFGAGYTAAQLYVALFTVANLKSAGYSDANIISAGFSGLLLKNGGYTANQLRSQFTVTQLVTAGYTAANILGAGYTATELRPTYTIAQLKGVSYSDADILAAGYTAALLLAAGYTATQLRANGYTIAQLKTGGYTDANILAAGYTADLLLAASYTATQLRVAGYSASHAQLGGYSDANILAAGFSATSLFEALYSATQLLDSGYTASQVKAGGFLDANILAAGFPASQMFSLYTATQLRQAGYTISQLQSAGYSVDNILSAGYSASALNAGGFTVGQLSLNGYTPAEMKAGGFSDSSILSGGFSASSLKTADYSAAELFANGYTALQLKNANYSDANILSAGYTSTQLKAVGYTAIQLSGVGYTISQLQAANYSVSQIIAAGYTATALRGVGFTAGQLMANYSAAQLQVAGFSDANILSAGFSASSLYGANYTASQLRGASYTVSQLKSGGYTDPQVLEAGYSVTQLLSSGYTSAQIKTAGYTLDNFVSANASKSVILAAGFSASALRAANYTAAELKLAGYPVSDLQSAGYSDSVILASGYTATQLLGASYSAGNLYSSGYTALSLRNAGYSDSSILAAGYSIANLKTAGYYPADLKASSFSDSDILSAGFLAVDLKDAGYTVAEVKAAGYSAIQLKSGGYLDAAILAGGYTADNLKAAGYTASELLGAEYSASSLREANYTVVELEQAGYTSASILGAGFLAVLLLNEGYTASELKAADYTALQLRNAGYTDSDILTIGYDANSLSVAGYTVSELRTYGYSDGELLTALAFVTEIAPTAPILYNVTAGDKSATIDFTDSNMVEVYGYKYSTNDTDYYWCATNTSPVTVTGLTNGQTYTITMKTVTSGGDSEPSSTSVTVTPGNVPNAPFITYIDISDGALEVNFIDGADNGSAITEYYYTVDDGDYNLVTPVSNKFTIPNLTNGVSYSVTMKAGNGFGLSVASPPSSKIPMASPSNPTITDIVGGNGMATVSFTLGDSNGGDVLFCGYSLDGETYLYTPNTTSPMEIYGLTNGYTYNVSIRAVNTLGFSEVSDTVSVTPITTPSKPIIIGITPESDMLIVKLIESDPNGFETVDYYYSLNGDEYVLADAPVNSEITIYNLPTGVEYTVLFKAHNSSGFSPASNSYSVLLPKLPPVPIITNVEPDNGRVSVYFSTSTIENAADIICYKYRLNNGTTDFYTNSAQSPVVIYGLNNGESYTVKIRAVTSIGETSFSLNSPAFIPYSYPEPPVITSVLPGDGNAIVYFNPLNGNGSEITKLSYYNGLTYVDLSGVTSPVTVRGLTNKTSYNILLVAHNEGGMSRLSNMKSIIPGTPYAPVITSVVPGAAKATIYFNQPAVTNGSSIINFNYDTGNGVQVKAAGMTSPIVITGLLNGKAYTISLYAVNANGSSVVSNVIQNITPFSIPATISISAVTPIYSTPTTSAALVSFVPPSSNGSSITKYMYAVGASTTYSDVSGIIPPLTITGLPMNATYTLKLISVNPAGNSSPSPASKPTIFKYSTPAQVKVTNVATSNQTLTVNFVAPASNGAPITAYLYSLNGGSYVNSGTATPPVVITGVQNNTNHNLQIVAVNDAGQSTPSTLLSKPVQIQYLAPLAPKIDSIIGQNGALDVRFTASVIRGAPVTTYYYTFDNGNTLVNANTTVSPFRINGLINDVSYSVCLVAGSGAGNSALSNRVLQKPILAAPAAPKINTITPGNQRAVVAYTAPLENGAPITNYMYTTNAGNTYVSIDSSSNPLTIIGLANNITYNLSIAAVNSIGRSLPSAPMSVMPRYTVPSAPVINTATPGVGAIATVAFTVSSPNGGTISTYKYTFDNGETYINSNSTKTPIIIRFLTPGQSYTIKMIAVNELGDSVASNTKTFTARA